MKITEMDINRIYVKYIVPEKEGVPKVLIQAINHPISAMRAELLEILKQQPAESGK